MKTTIDFSWYTHDDLLNLSFDRETVTKMEKGAAAILVRELAIRLQRATDELHRLER